MIRFYKAIVKIIRTLKSYLTGAVLKVMKVFLIIYSYVKSAMAFCKFTKNKKPVGKKRGLETYSDLGLTCKMVIDIETEKIIWIVKPRLSAQQLQ